MNPTLTNIANRVLVTGSRSFAGNAGASLILSVPVPFNCMAIIRARVRAVAGNLGVLAVVASAGADTLTLVAHGVVNGTPVYVGIAVGGTQPGGVTATTLYYARAASADTITLYDTQAHAVAGGATGLVDITSAGVTPLVFITTLNAAYFVDAILANKNGNTALVGSSTIVDYENVAAWACDIVANDTTDAAELKGTPDTVLATSFSAAVEYEIVSLAGN